MSAVQHGEAKRLLPIIFEAARAGKPITYKIAAERLGRDPEKNCRMVASVCDLLDAASALARIPPIALVTVLNEARKVNKNAWTDGKITAAERDKVIENAQSHKFSKADEDAMIRELAGLESRGLGRKTAWNYIKEITPSEEFIRCLMGQPMLPSSDAIEDLAVEAPGSQPYAGLRYMRDQKVRDHARLRADGRCEFCNELGFESDDGTRYLECHHIISLAKQGPDHLSNVIALCPKDHREAHYGKRRDELEKGMVAKLKVIIGNAKTSS